MNKKIKDERVVSTDFEELKIAREKRELSIEEIAEKINIKPQFIRAIEESDLSALPGGVYNKAYIKSYSEFLDVKLKGFSDIENKLSNPEISRVAVSIGNEDNSKVSPSKLIILCCLLLITLLYSFFFSGEENPQDYVRKYNKDSESPIKNEAKLVKNQKLLVTILANKEVGVELLDFNDKIFIAKKLAQKEAIIIQAKDISKLNVSELEDIDIFLNGILVDKTKLKKPEEEKYYIFSVNELFASIKSPETETKKNKNPVKDKLKTSE